jgi:hypothetical protein
MKFSTKYRVSNFNSVNKLELIEISIFTPWRNRKTKCCIIDQSIKIIDLESNKIIKVYNHNDLEFVSIKLKSRSINLIADFPTKINLTITPNDNNRSLSVLYNKLILILNLERHKPISQLIHNKRESFQNGIPDLFSNYHPKFKYIFSYEKNGEFIMGSHSDMQLIKPSIRINLTSGEINIKNFLITKTIEKKDILEFAINTGTNHFRYVDNFRNLVFGKLILIDKKGRRHTILNTMGKSMEETNNIDQNKEYEIEYELLRLREKIIDKIYST